MTPTDRFVAARTLLLQNRDDYATAYREFRWPVFETFNWALDWFDVHARGNDRTALWLARPDQPDEKLSFAELSERSSRVATFLRAQGICRGDRILVMLPNLLPIWELTLGAMKLGAVVVPTSIQATTLDLVDRCERGAVRLAVTDAAGADKLETVKGDFKRCLVGPRRAGWLPYDDARAAPAGFVPDGPTRPEDPFLLYFTSGTTALPKLVLHTHQSYPVGHLSTMYWLGIREGEIHQNISSPGWAKHAWSSFFAPWNAGATVFVHDYARFSAKVTLDLLERHGINSLCAPPTVWRMLILESLGARPRALRELASAGEPLNPEVIARIEQTWGLTIRDGYGQTETTAVVGNSPGQPVKVGSMGRPMPGYRVTLLGADGREGRDGELALCLEPRPTGLMAGYLDDPKRTEQAMAGGFYRTGDEAAVDDNGYLHFVGRGDDVFKSSDYRISPFELESVLLEHDAVAEAAIVPSPDPVRLCVPKAFVVLKPGVAAGATTARDILQLVNGRLAAYKRIRRIEFGELPKTISGKIRRVQLRRLETERHELGARGAEEYRLEDLEPR